MSLEPDTIITLDALEASSQPIFTQENSMPSRRGMIPGHILESKLSKCSEPIRPKPIEPELIFISQDPGEKEEAGSDITIYVLDTGANPDHSEYTRMPGQKSWLWPDPHTIWTQLSGYNLETDPDGHGSCVLSKIAGVEYGVAKKPDIVIVKMLQISNIGFSLAYTLKSLEIIIGDVVDRGVGGKSVLLIAPEVIAESENVSSSLIRLINELIEEDVVVVTGAGDSRVRGFHNFF